MKALTMVVRILLIVGGLGVLIFYPIMFKNIDNDTMFSWLNAVSTVSAVMAGIGLFLGFVRAILLLAQSEQNKKLR